MSANYPTGLVTFVFTDIEGSTQRWEAYGDAMAAALQRHDTLVRQAFETYQGVVFKTVGDAFCAAFRAPQEALNAALDAQRRLAAEDFSSVGGLRVRMALHTGTADERDLDYFGPTVNRVARLLAIGHGGQVLMSAATAELVKVSGTTAPSLRDHGRHRLKDLELPERVFELIADDLPHEFPPLRSLSELSNNLPLQMTQFVGREREVGEIIALLRRDRVVTIVGSGGVGKTRTALQVAAQLVDGSGDGVWLVELAALPDGSSIPAAIAQALNLQLPATDDQVQALGRAMRRMRVLLVLDNCEHIVESAAATVAEIVQRCPDVSVLATSRQALGIGGEIVFRLPSLALDESVALFAVRARAVDQRFVLSDQNRPIVEDICNRLDGIALAIELAAARVKVLSPDQLRGRLDERFRVLTGGRRDVLPRQQTMRAVIDWSYDLLTEPERILLRRLSIFAGGWTLGAAEAVCAGGAVEEHDILDLHASLIEKSLVAADVGEDDARYRLLESTRAYAAERLDESGERSQTAKHHTEWMARFAASEYKRLRQLHVEVPPPSLQVEFDNFRSALTWALNCDGDPVLVARIAITLGDFLEPTALAEGRRWVNAAIDKLDASAEPALAAKLHSVLERTVFGKDRAAAAARAVELYAAAGDEVSMAGACFSLGFAQTLIGEHAAALASVEKGLAIYRERGMTQADRYGAGLVNRGIILQNHGRFEEAHASLSEAVELYDRLGFQQRAALARMDLAETEAVSGNYAKAIALADEAGDVLRKIGHLRGQACAGVNAAAYHLLVGNFAEAAAKAVDALAPARQVQDLVRVSICIQHLATVAALRGDATRAAHLMGYSDATYRRLGVAREITEQRTYELLVGALRAQLSEDAIERLSSQGEALTEDLAVAEAITNAGDTENAHGSRAS